MQPDELDQRQDLRLGAAQQDRAPATPDPPGEHRQVEHQRRVGEHQLAEVDADIRLGAERPCQGSAPAALSGAVLVSGAPEDRGVVSKLDDS